MSRGVRVGREREVRVGRERGGESTGESIKRVSGGERDGVRVGRERV